MYSFSERKTSSAPSSDFAYAKFEESAYAKLEENGRPNTAINTMIGAIILYSQLIGFPKPFNATVWFISLCYKEIENHYNWKYRKTICFPV